MINDKEARASMSDIYSEDIIMDWSDDQLVEQVANLDLNTFINYPEYLHILFIWLTIKRGR